MSRLEPRDFARFFHAVRGHPPFPWQQRLVAEVEGRGRWPALLDLPTGSGKTAVLDVATFLLALDAQRGSLRFPRRTVLVVDRRIVVDQAASAGRGLLDALLRPADPTVAAVADALRSLSGTDVPLVVATMRGGALRDDAWARRPDVPSLVSSTVDQVGSRLLFRGYGVSDSMRPVHAGLLGCDTLLLLDEVHLSQPFAETLRALASRHRTAEELRLPSRWQVVEMSATPGEPTGDALRLDQATDLDPVSSPVLSQRVNARKPVVLWEITAGRPGRRALAEACAREVVALLEHPQVRTPGVIVNRVETARAVGRRLREAYGLTVALLTGRMRPFDRDDLLARWDDRMRTGRERHEDADPLVVVGTQCLEAGADFDLDGLVTECASLDALRQRFGRVDRAGELSAAGTPAPGVILALPGDIAADAEDRVYGRALGRTWTWMTEHPELDFGIAHLPAVDRSDAAALLPPRVHAPVLLPAHLDALAQTAPPPEPSPDVSLWLHGLRPTGTDVQVIWRADLNERFLEHGGDDVIRLIEACPPGSGEAATVPIGAVRSWLQRKDPGGDGIADVDGLAAPDSHDASGQEPARLHVRWRGREGIVLQDDDLRPGDVVVVPASYGGLREGSWDPGATEPVTDLGHRAQLHRRRLVLRLIPPVCRPLGVPEADDPDAAPTDVVLEWLRERGDELADPHSREIAGLLAGRRLDVQIRRAPIFPEPDSNGSGETRDYLVCSAFVPRSMRGDGFAGEADSEPLTSSFAGPRPVSLEQHLTGVRDTVGAIARNCGLPSELIGALELAGRLHDLGKLDPRFQRWLRGGDELAVAMADAPLAKSGVPADDRERRELARRLSGYPRGARHELLSLALAQGASWFGEHGGDTDLVLHLIASHHGGCRPFAPVAPDHLPEKVTASVDGHDLESSTGHGLERLDAGIPDRFWRLLERYGWFGLAWLEGMLRLADHHQSDREQLAAVDAE